LHAYGVLTACELDGKTVPEGEAADAGWAVQGLLKVSLRAVNHLIII